MDDRQMVNMRRFSAALRGSAVPLPALSETAEPELGPCHMCSGEADGTCVICDLPVCDEDAVRRDYDRFCRACAGYAPHPGGAGR